MIVSVKPAIVSFSRRRESSIQSSRIADKTFDFDDFFKHPSKTWIYASVGMTGRWLKRIIACLLLAALAIPALAAFDVSQLMSELAKHKGGKAKFVEKKYISLLDKPVISSGEMSYSAPDRLEKRTLTPKVETLLLDKDLLSIEREKQKLTINLSNQPEALAFIDSIRGTLTGNRAALEKNYLLSLTGTQDKWVLTLLPSEQKIAALVLRIVVSGGKGQIRSIEYLQADGDRSVMSLEPIELK